VVVATTASHLALSCTGTSTSLIWRSQLAVCLVETKMVVLAEKIRLVSHDLSLDL
jgi:hypothetical protein